VGFTNNKFIKKCGGNYKIITSQEDKKGGHKITPYTVHIHGGNYSSNNSLTRYIITVHTNRIKKGERHNIIISL